MSDVTSFSITTHSPAIREVSFSNPPVNVVGPDTVADLNRIVKDLSGDAAVRVVIFSSGIDDYFYNHADLAEVAELESMVVLDGTPTFIDLVVNLSTAPFISIASIRGRTRGGGDELALAFDLRYASRERAVFGQPEVATGVLPGGGAAARLAGLLGRDRALEVLLTSDDYDADRAEKYGWITRALPDADLDEFVHTVAARIAAYDSAAVRGVKEQINQTTLPGTPQLRAAWAAFSESTTWPGFQQRLPQFAQLIEQVGLDDVELNLGRYLGMTSQTS